MSNSLHRLEPVTVIYNMRCSLQLNLTQRNKHTKVTSTLPCKDAWQLCLRKAAAVSASHLVDSQTDITVGCKDNVTLFPSKCSTLTCVKHDIPRGIILQAGVDLGSVRADQQAAKKKQGRDRKKGAPLAQLRPKRRAPVSQACHFVIMTSQK